MHLAEQMTMNYHLNIDLIEVAELILDDEIVINALPWSAS